MDHLSQRYTDMPIHALGYSMGGSVLLKYLAEQGGSSKLKSAVSVSVPFQLSASANALNQGFAKVYQYFLILGLKRFLKEKKQSGVKIEDLHEILSSKNFWEFDNAYTARVHGFKMFITTIKYQAVLVIWVNQVSYSDRSCKRRPVGAS